MEHDFRIHEVCHTFPRMTRESKEGQSFIQDIRERGQIEPISVFIEKTDDGDIYWIIDGQNRYAVCQFLRIEPKFKVYTGPTDMESLQAYSWSENAERRHLTVDQKACFAALMANAARGAQPGRAAWNRKLNPSTEGFSSEPSISRKSRSIAQAAKTVGVSRAQAERARALHKNDPERFQKVLANKAKLQEPTPKPQQPKAAPTKKMPRKQKATLDMLRSIEPGEAHPDFATGVKAYARTL